MDELSAMRVEKSDKLITSQGGERRVFTVMRISFQGHDGSVTWQLCELLIGNRNSKIYHKSNCPDYNKVSEKNRVPFKTEAEAQAAGYRKARNCPQ
jgi:hypothetical protein